jgi:hypothetical protein
MVGEQKKKKTPRSRITHAMQMMKKRRMQTFIADGWKGTTICDDFENEKVCGFAFGRSGHMIFLALDADWLFLNIMIF